MMGCSGSVRPNRGGGCGGGGGAGGGGGGGGPVGVPFKRTFDVPLE